MLLLCPKCIRQCELYALQAYIPFIIDETQSEFIEGRHLLHSVLIANEVIEEAKRNNKSCLVFKVDYKKAYDSVSWNFYYTCWKEQVSALNGSNGLRSV